MGEGFISGLAGGEDEKVDSTEGGAEAFAVAVAANLAHQNPAVAAATVTFLHEQTELLRAQRHAITDEHAFFGAERGPRLLGLRLRACLQVFMALIAGIIGLGLCLVIWQGVHARSVVIDPFEVPPALVADGLSGTVVAAGFLDVLARIQTASRSNIESRQLSNAWVNEIAVDVPETGISLAQLERMVKTHFGHDQHIGGELVRRGPGSLALTVRGDDVPARTFTGADGALDQLLTQAGEYVFSQSQPGLWTAYLSNNDRNDEAIAFAQAVNGSVAASERPYVLNYWANSITGKGGVDAQAQALALYREAVRLKPDYWTAYNNVMYSQNALGDEEGMVRTAEQMMRLAGGRPGRAPELQYQNYDESVRAIGAERASTLADMDAHGGIGTAASSAGAGSLNVAQMDVWLHDPQAAALRVQAVTVNDASPADVAQAAFDRAQIAEEAGDLQTAAREWDAYAAAYANAAVATGNPNYICYAAVTYQRTGQAAKADASLAPFGGRQYVDCYRFRADVLDLRGDWPGAQAWYARAVALAPSLPLGYYSWGLALARHGELAAAAAKLELASQKGPQWADPLKAWGDVLMQQGQPRQALAKYEQALEFAPNWQQLKLSRDAAAKHRG